MFKFLLRLIQSPVGSMSRQQLEEQMKREEAQGCYNSVYHLEHKARYEP